MYDIVYLTFSNDSTPVSHAIEKARELNKEIIQQQLEDTSTLMKMFI